MMYCKLLAVTLLLAASCQARPKWGSAQRSSPWGQSGNHGSTWEMTIVEGVGPSGSQVYGVYPGNPWAGVDDDQVGSSSNQWNSQHGVNSPSWGSSGMSANIRNNPSGSQVYGVYPGNPWAGVDDDQVGSSSNQWNSQHGVQQGGQHGVNIPSWGSSGMSANIRNNPSGSNWGSQQEQGRSGSSWAGQQSQHGSGWGSGSSWKASGSGAWSGNGNGNGYGSNPWGGASEQSRAGRTNSWTNSWTNSADVDQPWSVGHLMNNPVSGGNRVNQVGKNGNGWVVVSSPWAGSDEDDQSVEVGNHGVHQASGRGWGQGVNQQGSNQGSSWSWGQGQSSQRGNHVSGQVVSRSLGQGGNHQGWNQGGSQHGVNQGGNQHGINQGGNQHGVNQGGNQHGVNQGGNQHGVNQGGNQHGVNQGSNQHGVNQGSNQQGGNQGGNQHGVNQGSNQQGGNQGWNQGGHQGGNQGSSWSWGQGQNQQGGSHGGSQGGSHNNPNGGWGQGSQNGAAVVSSSVHNPVGHGHLSSVASGSHHGHGPYQHGDNQDSDEQESSTGGQHGHHHHDDADDEESQSMTHQYGRRQY